MVARLTSSQVLELAPDASGARAGTGLAGPGPWSLAATDGTLLWGRCAGSGKNPYVVVVDLAGPAYRCSCPSRKFPCKHALGLMLRWSAGAVEDSTDVPADAAAWRDGRATRAERTSAPAVLADPAATRRREQRRGAEVTAGLDELDRWLADQVRTGLAALPGRGYAHLDAIAARMVDAKAPAVAGTLRQLAGITAAGGDWPARLLGELALLRLLVAAHRRLDELPADLAASVRTHVGYPTRREDVLALEPVTDRWCAVGRRTSSTERLVTRRMWLRGERTGRSALLLSHAPEAGGLEPAPPVGTVVEVAAHFYPGSLPLRVVLAAGELVPEPVAVPAVDPALCTVDAARAGWADAVAADPWVPEWPVLLQASLGCHDGRWSATDAAGRTVACTGAPWELLATTRGRPALLAGEWHAGGFTPLTAWTPEGVVTA